MRGGGGSGVAVVVLVVRRNLLEVLIDLEPDAVALEHLTGCAQQLGVVRVAAEAAADTEDLHRLRLLRELEVRQQRDLVGQRRLATRERVVPVDPEPRAIDLRLELEAEALPAVRV